MIYDVNYFIKKFEAIPESLWITGNNTDLTGVKHCAGGHCGLSSGFSLTKEFSGLNKIFNCLKTTNKTDGDFFTAYIVTRINDNETKEYQQPTPKQRILAALYDIKKMQVAEVGKEKPKKVIRYVAVDAAIKEMELVEN